MKQTSQRSLLFRQNVNRTEAEWVHFLDGYRKALIEFDMKKFGDDWHTAEDIVEEIFLNIVRELRITALRPQDSFRHVLINMCMQKHKSFTKPWRKTMWGQAPELGFEMVTFLTFLARYGIGGGTSRRMPKGALMSGFEKPPPASTAGKGAGRLRRGDASDVRCQEAFETGLWHRSIRQRRQLVKDDRHKQAPCARTRPLDALSLGPFCRLLI